MLILLYCKAFSILYRICLRRLVYTHTRISGCFRPPPYIRGVYTHTCMCIYTYMPTLHSAAQRMQTRTRRKTGTRYELLTRNEFLFSRRYPIIDGGLATLSQAVIHTSGMMSLVLMPSGLQDGARPAREGTAEAWRPSRGDGDFVSFSRRQNSAAGGQNQNSWGLYY